MTRPDGIPVNAVYGFISMLMKLLDETDADYVAVIFDKKRRTFRHDIFPDYKANRPDLPADLIPQFELVRDAVAALNQYYDEDQERREDKRNKIMRTPINDFELSVRSRNCLAKMNIRTLGDLVKKTEAELLSYKNFGETSLYEIKHILNQKNLRLGQLLEDPGSSLRRPWR